MRVLILFGDGSRGERELHAGDVFEQVKLLIQGRLIRSLSMNGAAAEYHQQTKSSQTMEERPNENEGPLSGRAE